MIKTLIAVLFAFVSVAGGNSDTLAPHPVYFTGDGRPTVERIILDGKYYDVGWDGASLTLEHGKRPPYGAEPPNEGPPFDWSDDGGEWEPAPWAGALFIVGGSIVIFLFVLFLIWLF